ncbi:hypothetical protein GCM10010405_13570 [Streptomyces macrosporus]|uniref:Uncharacterized protein n=1 Tax=Streptomyces macrosporus TaxID=44032 RepID=A0ABP5WNH5_9ACTN
MGGVGRTDRFSANVQVIVDARAWRTSGSAEHCQNVTVLGDGAHPDTGLTVPHRKRPGRVLPAEAERT